MAICQNPDFKIFNILLFLENIISLQETLVEVFITCLYYDTVILKISASVQSTEHAAISTVLLTFEK